MPGSHLIEFSGILTGNGSTAAHASPYLGNAHCTIHKGHVAVVIRIISSTLLTESSSTSLRMLGPLLLSSTFFVFFVLNNVDISVVFTFLLPFVYIY